MKKALSIFIFLVIVISVLGCSNIGKSDEELKQELKNQIEAEMAAQQETEKNTDEQEDENTHSPSNQSSDLYLSNLNNGDTIWGGLTINDINYDNSSGTPPREVGFVLEGELEVEGQIFFDEYYDAILLSINENSVFDNPLIIEFPDNYVHEYIPDYLLFINEETLLSNISANDVKEIKQNDKKLSVKIRIRDIGAAMLYESEGSNWCTFVELIEY